MKARTKRISIVAVVAATAALGTTIAVASIPAPDGTIHGCRSTVTGAMRVIDSNVSCGPLQTSLNWAQAGAPGSTGPQGPQGVAGPRGDPGDSGPQSTIIYSHHVTSSSDTYADPCPTGYYVLSVAQYSDDGGSSSGGVGGFGPTPQPLQLGYPVSPPFTVYIVCSYYGAVIAQ